MKKVINPCTCEVWGNSGKTRQANAYAKIEWDGKRLSICGVVGPMSNGNCLGSAGQCTDSIRGGTPVDGWTREMLDKLCDIWDRWHLNDMNPCCKHQRELGWLEQAKEQITLYHYHLKREASNAKKAAEKATVDALCKGETFTPTGEQSFYAALPEWLDIYGVPREELAPYYEPFKSSYRGDKEVHLRGNVWYGASDESTLTRVCDERGLLCKPCPVCGYKYGHAWKTEEVPQEVIDWLFNLSESPVEPAWV